MREPLTNPAGGSLHQHTHKRVRTMPENAIVGVVIARKGRTWRVQVQRRLFGEFVRVETVADGLKLADARAEGQRVASENGVQVREAK